MDLVVIIVVTIFLVGSMWLIHLANKQNENKK